MAELNDSQKEASGSRKIRSSKLSSRVDLTAMVDLAFLLITFFMLTTSLGKPNSMDLAMPQPSDIAMPVDENRTMTILIGADGKAKYFMGQFDPSKVQNVNLTTTALRQQILERKKDVLKYSTSKGKPENGIIVLIKPGENSNYGDLINVLDEMAISDVPSYAIVDIAPKEDKLL